MRHPLWIAAAAAALLLPAAGPLAIAADVPAAVSGKVFDDANRNGRLDPGEVGRPGVRITDGVNFAVTGADGAYSIAVAADPIIPWKGSQVVNVCWPDGTWPTGRWWARLDQITDAGRVDFGLREDRQQSLPFVFLHVSDDHGAGYEHHVGPRLKETGDTVKFCFNTGDMGYAGLGGADAMFANIAGWAARFPVPMFFAIGNHDCVKDTPIDSGPLAGVGGFTTHLGPIRWSFGYAGVHFTSIDWWDPYIKEHVEGSAPPAAADWLEKDLQGVKDGTRIVLLIHFPSGCQQYFDVIARHKVAQAFGGHNHRHEFYNYAGVPAATTVNPEAGGSGNFGVVTKDAIDVVCVAWGGEHGPLYHGKLCALSAAWKSGTGAIAVPAGQPDRSLGATNVVLDSAAQTVDAGPSQGVSVTVEFAPGTAQRAGLRIGAGQPVEIAFTGRTIEAAGAPIPFILYPHDGNAVKLQVTIGGGLMTLQANSRIRMAKPKPVTVENAGRVTLFAEGGRAEFRTVSVTGLK